MIKSDRLTKNPLPLAKTLPLQLITGRGDPRSLKLEGTLARPHWFSSCGEDGTDLKRSWPVVA